MKRDHVFDRPAALLGGAHLARVVSLDDPDGLSRVQVRLIGFDDVDAQDAPLWARVVSAFAGNDRGAFLMPDVDDEVLVVFAGADGRQPLVLGGLWNGAAAPPAAFEGGQNRYKCLRSKNGVTVMLDDQQGQETLTLETPGGQKMTLKDGPGTVTIEDSNGNTIELGTSGIKVTAAASVEVQAAQAKVSAGMVTVDAAMSKFSGIVQCDVLKTNSVISMAYTMGAGNIW